MELNGDVEQGITGGVKWGCGARDNWWSRMGMWSKG